MPHSLDDLPAGATVFIDANIFVYHFVESSKQCKTFLARCEQGELFGVTGVHVLLEVLHRLMMIEAVEAGLVSPGNVPRKLRERPDVIGQLQDYQDYTDTIPDMGIDVRPLTVDIVQISLAYRHRYGLLVNDSVTLALAVSDGLDSLATADKDFRRVDEVTIYQPDDLR
mgnify:CR=1 FL=1